MKKPLLILLLLISQIAFAEDDLAEYMDNGLPIYYGLMDGKTPVYIEFTDVIQDRYMVDVEWFPDWGLVPFFTGRANINFKLVDRDVKFSIKANLFHIGRQFINATNITSKEAIKVKFSDLTSTPFTFRDVNFDGINELVITNKQGGQRFYDSYKVHLIQEVEDTNYFNVLDLSKTMPYSKFDATTEFNTDDKTVWMYYSGGARSSSYELYQRVFSDYSLGDYQFKLIKKTDYRYWDEDGNDIPCHKYVYDVINGKDVLIESESGSVD